MWTDERMVGFDLETTAPDPQEARIVTAAIVAVGGGLATEELALLADPGVEIPEGAAAVHGITTERARAEGKPLDVVVSTVLAALTSYARAGAPIVVFNARYDLTVLDRMARLFGLQPLQLAVPGLRVVDPLVIDKQLERYRKGSRKLDAQCAYWQADLTDAHDATADALAAARLAWRICRGGQVVRKARDPQEQAELASLREEWEQVRGDLGRLHEAQVRWALAERDRFAAYKASVGEHEEAAKISGEVGWPVLELRLHSTINARTEMPTMQEVFDL